MNICVEDDQVTRLRNTYDFNRSANLLVSTVTLYGRAYAYFSRDTFFSISSHILKDISFCGGITLFLTMNKI